MGIVWNQGEKYFATKTNKLYDKNVFWTVRVRLDVAYPEVACTQAEILNFGLKEPLWSPVHLLANKGNYFPCKLIQINSNLLSPRLQVLLRACNPNVEKGFYSRFTETVCCS